MKIPKALSPYSEYNKPKMNDYLLDFKHGLNINKWAGIKSHSNNIIRKFAHGKKSGVNSDPVFRSELQNKIFEAIGESLKEYSPPKKLGVLEPFKLSAMTETHLRMYNFDREGIINEIESNLLDYLEGNEIATPFSQLMVLNNSFSRNIESLLRSDRGGAPLSNFEIFEIMSSYSPRCKFMQPLFKKMCDAMDARVVFAFALNAELGVAVTRNVVHDEYLGTIAQIVSETLPLIIMNRKPKNLEWGEDAQLDFVKNYILFLEIELFLSKAEDFVKLLRDTSLSRLLDQPF
jgi:hypothetical protein